MVSEFVEKPDPDTAQGYLDTGDYLWNSGNSCFGPSVTLRNSADTGRHIGCMPAGDGDHHRRPGFS